MIIQIGDGSFLCALEGPGSYGSAVIAKCVAASLGLLKALKMSLTKVILEGDCKAVISSSIKHYFMPLVCQGFYFGQ